MQPNFVKEWIHESRLLVHHVFRWARGWLLKLSMEHNWMSNRQAIGVHLFVDCRGWLGKTIAAEFLGPCSAGLYLTAESSISPEAYALTFPGSALKVLLSKLYKSMAMYVDASFRVVHRCQYDAGAGADAPMGGAPTCTQAVLASFPSFFSLFFPLFFSFYIFPDLTLLSFSFSSFHF